MKTGIIKWVGVAAFAALATGGAMAAPTPTDGVPKIIIDSDYNTMSDDGQLGVMAAQLQAEGKLKVMGITVVSGNQWLKQGVADALKSVERLGAGSQIGIYSGANYAFDHNYATIKRELAAGAGGDGYLGAWDSPEPRHASDLKAPPDGFAKRTYVQREHAVDFIIRTVKANPHEITVLAVGPLTNLALAAKRDPSIVPLIKQIIYMGGAVHVAGNTTKAAEFNWWFDPDAAREVVRLPIPQVVVPLDVTDTVFLTKPIYDRIAHPAHPTAVTEVYRQMNGYGFTGKDGFENNPNYTQNIWDTLTIAYLLDPSYATEVSEEYLDVVAKPGRPDNGRSIGYARQPEGAALQKVKIVKQFDSKRFFELYVDLLTRPVPVRLAQ